MHHKKGLLIAMLAAAAAASAAPPPSPPSPSHPAVSATDPCRPWEARMAELRHKRERFAWNEPTFAKRVEQARGRYDKDMAPGGACGRRPGAGAGAAHGHPGGHPGGY